VPPRRQPPQHRGRAAWDATADDIGQTSAASAICCSSGAGSPSNGPARRLQRGRASRGHSAASGDTHR
jgi:hypothetical protein